MVNHYDYPYSHVWGNNTGIKDFVKELYFNTVSSGRGQSIQSNRCLVQKLRFRNTCVYLCLRGQCKIAKEALRP